MTKPAITRPARHSYYTSENVWNLALFPAEMKPTIRPMRTKEAKDFLVAQTAEQAALEGVPLSDLEKRMMYFTESGYVPEDPIKLNEEFEAENDSDKYEAKISGLLHRAYTRVRKENDAARKNWDLAIRCLRRGDHYLLVMWDLTPSTWTPLGDSMKLFASSLGVAALFAALGILASFIGPKFEPQWRWLQGASQTHWRLLFGIFIAIYLAVLFFPRRVGNAMDWLLDHTFSLFGAKEDEKDRE